MRIVKIAVVALLLLLPVCLVLALDPAAWQSKGEFLYAAAGTLVFLDLPIAVCLLHWSRPRWFRLRNGFPSPLPWLLLTLIGWGFVAGTTCLDIRLGRYPENGFSTFCAYYLGWVYIWLTTIPIGMLYLLLRALVYLVEKLRKRRRTPRAEE